MTTDTVRIPADMVDRIVSDFVHDVVLAALDRPEVVIALPSIGDIDKLRRVGWIT